MLALHPLAEQPFGQLFVVRKRARPCAIRFRL